MKFTKIPLSILILLCVLKFSTSQLFESFNDEPSHLEKKSRSLFDDSEENIKPPTPTPQKKEKNTNNKIASIFGSVEDETVKPIELQKNQPIQQINNQVKIQNKNINIKSNVSQGPIRSINNQAENNLKNNNKNNSAINVNLADLVNNKKTKEIKDDIQLKQEKLQKLKNKNSEKMKLQKEEIKHLQEKFDLINQKTKNIMKVMKNNSSLEKIKGKYKDNIDLVEGYSKDYKYMNKNINKLENNIEAISSELNVIENKKDLKDVKEIKKIDVAHKLKVEGNLNTKKLLTEELKFGENKISNNFIQLDKDFKIIYKNQVRLILF